MDGQSPPTLQQKLQAVASVPKGLNLKHLTSCLECVNMLRRMLISSDSQQLQITKITAQTFSS